MDSIRLPRPHLEGVTCSQENDMRAVAIFVSIFVAFAVMFLPLILSGETWKATQDRERARRIADAKMNARLLKLNL